MLQHLQDVITQELYNKMAILNLDISAKLDIYIHQGEISTITFELSEEEKQAGLVFNPESKLLAAKYLGATPIVYDKTNGLVINSDVIQWTVKSNDFNENMFFQLNAFAEGQKTLGGIIYLLDAIIC